MRGLFGALLLGIACVAVAGCGGSSTNESSAAYSKSAPAYGTLVDQKVPAALERIPLTNQRGQRVDLASWSGKTVMLVPFLTLCADICPFTTGILLQVEAALRADHAASKVKIVELTVDPHRDTPARLAAYAKLTHAGWEMVTESPANLAALSKFFGFSYEKIPEDNPPLDRLVDGQATDLRRRPLRQLLRRRPGGRRAGGAGRSPGLQGASEPQAAEVPQPARPRAPEAPTTA